LRPLVQRGGDRARHGEERLLLLPQQEALHLVHVQDPRQGQSSQRQEDERQLHAQTEAQPLHACQR
jgi:hypothetical protein